MQTEICTLAKKIEPGNRVIVKGKSTLGENAPAIVVEILEDRIKLLGLKIVDDKSFYSYEEVNPIFIEMTDLPKADSNYHSVLIGRDKLKEQQSSVWVNEIWDYKRVVRRSAIKSLKYDRSRSKGSNT